ncbi:MAG: Cna B domain protein [Methanothrix harundinacea]|uniref:Cna B domain protein n=1 Tax=Methanothrix harundinacea TaxID=301375 RepID=A0A124G3H5_9EURY|nr:MAG: Cna B domain protein [Methanothrix harundinacea]
MKGPSKKKDAEAKIKNASGNFVKSSCKRALRLTLTLLVLGAFATSAAVANDPPVAVDLSSDKASPQTVGTPINFEAVATDPDGDTLQYQFWVKVGNNEIDFWVRDGNHAGPDSFDSEKLIPFTIQPPSNQPPVVTALTPSRASPQIAGTRVTWTASASDPDGDQILYRFWMKGPSTGNIWKVVRDWSSSRTWTWSTSSGDAGQYDFCVYVRDGKHQPAGRYDDCTGYKGYQLIVVRPVNQPPVVKALSPSRSSPSTAGSTVVWTASASDPERDLLYYKFWLRGPSTGNSWTVARDWSTSSTWTWSSSPGDAGSYDVYVYVRDGRHEPPTRYDSAKGYGGYQLTAPAPVNQPPTVTALSPSRASPSAAGSTVVWTASASDPERDLLYYKFWLRGPSTGNSWTVARDWSTSSTWTWSSSPGDAGSYDVYVYVRDGRHEPASGYDSAKGYGGYRLTAPAPASRPPTVTALSPSRPSPQAAGSTIVWTASATDPDGDPLLYKFWMKGPSTENAWQVVQDWTASPSWTWSSAPGDAGEYSLYVYVRDGKHEPASRYDSAIGYSGYQLVSTGGVYQLTSGAAIQDRPSLIFADDGYLLAYQSWETGSLYSGDIFMKRFDPRWAQLQKVAATDDPAYQDTPSAIFSDGYYYVAYVSDETGNWDIFVKKYDRNLNLVETRRITTSPADQDSPSLVRAGGDFYLAYQSWETGSSYGGDIFIERFNSAWTPIRKMRVTTETSYQDRPSLAYSTDDDRLYIAYASDETEGRDIFVKKYDRSLNSLEKRRITSSSSIQDYPSLVVQSGEFDLVYSSQEGGSRDLYLGRFGPDWSLIERVPLTGTSGDELWPSLIYSPFDGLLWVAYVLQDAVGGDIFVQPARSMTGCWASMDFSAMVAYSPYTLTARFYGPTGELVDPSSLRLTWSPADAVLTSSTLRKVSTGTYQLQSRFGSAGLKTFTLSSAVNGCSAENTVTVQVA